MKEINKAFTHIKKMIKLAWLYGFTEYELDAYE